MKLTSQEKVCNKFIKAAINAIERLCPTTPIKASIIPHNIDKSGCKCYEDGSTYISTGFNSVIKIADCPICFNPFNNPDYFNYGW